ncbi:helix-turn-helix transcriptional regulator [Sphaerotilaceae bacterium SBD11-9]
MNPLKFSDLADDLRLFSRADLTDAPAVTEVQAIVNRATGRGPVRPRPQRCGLLSVSEATFDRMVANGAFPKPVKVGPRLVRWKATDIRDWLDRSSC